MRTSNVRDTDLHQQVRHIQQWPAIRVEALRCDLTEHPVSKSTAEDATYRSA